MPGAYAHLSMVNDAKTFAEQTGLQEETLYSLGVHLKFLELGAVSPDYPYLALKNGQAQWADAMHYTSTASLLRSGVETIARLNGLARQKATSWFLGLAAHVAMDMTIHPVIELRVGPYKGNENAHRRCEMHQDAFIFPHVMNVGDTGLSHHLRSGIAKCHANGDEDKIDSTIENVWTQMLQATYPDIGIPEPSIWHHGFRDVLAAVTEANQLLPFARHVAAHLNLTYPAEKDIDSSYIKQLRTPEGPMDYIDIYQRARCNVLAMWKGLDDALAGHGLETLDLLEDWNLDTGRSVQTAKLVFWQEAA
ncbi:zinc dependent phospholipase C family protein [Comamonas sp. MYb21]|uniref:zinc dependent phospholipase C family protein n=1 Tax=Comamonas sp. MYb21 TaxID=1848648 RepID=UPI003095E7A8